MSSEADATGPGDPVPSQEQMLLRQYLGAAHKIAERFAWSHGRVEGLMPLDAVRIDALGPEDEEKLDAFLLRFNSLAAMIQDHLTRALLQAEEEDISDRSRKDQRLLMEKLGALNPELGFGTIAELRNKIAHHYPDESAKQAEILNEVFKRSADLVDAYNGVLRFAGEHSFNNRLELDAIELVSSRSGA